MKTLSSLRTKLLEFMYSSEDLERFYFQYQTEALPHGESLRSFCVKNKVPYNIFQKWYKDTRKKVVEVQIDGLPAADSEESTKSCPQSRSVSERRTGNPVRILIDIRMTNGMHIRQRNLNYHELKTLVEKLEGLC